jgi:type III secretion protein N (ATPase)
MSTVDQALFRKALDAAPPFERRGRVAWAFGGVIKATGLDVRIGQLCLLVDPSGRTVPAEVIGFAEHTTLLSPLKPLHGLSASVEIVPGAIHSTVACGPGLLGRVIDGLGQPLDGLGPITGPLATRDIYASAPGPLERDAIGAVFPTGVRAIDALLTVGVGQRTGIFATAGGGKSTLLGMLGRHGGGDMNVIALIGERGREVAEFLAQALGPAGLARSVVVASTSDRPAIERVRAANLATAIAEGARAEGKQVVLMMDSVTRYARALREIGLAAGEPAVRRGFTPSVFADLPRLFERAGAAGGGSITAFYTVLLEESEEGADPIGEEVRSILDGHVYLSRRIGESGRYPAIDVPASVSRLFDVLANDAQRSAARLVRAWIAKYSEVELLLQIGEYKPGQDAAADRAIERIPHIERFLSQPADCLAVHSDTLGELQELVA